VCAIQHFDCFLWGNLVKVITDHQPNVALTESDVSKLNNRLSHFALKLAGRVSEIVWVPGEQVGNADGLSRSFEENEEDEDVFVSSPVGGPKAASVQEGGDVGPRPHDLGTAT